MVGDYENFRLNQNIDDFLLKMPFDKGSAAMSFEVEKLSGNAAL